MRQGIRIVFENSQFVHVKCRVNWNIFQDKYRGGESFYSWKIGFANCSGTNVINDDHFSFDLDDDSISRGREKKTNEWKVIKVKLQSKKKKNRLFAACQTIKKLVSRR